jgi:hypothetical protein
LATVHQERLKIADVPIYIWNRNFFYYSYIHMCIHCLGHFSPSPPPPPPSSHLLPQNLSVNRNSEWDQLYSFLLETQKLRIIIDFFFFFAFKGIHLCWI